MYKEKGGDREVKRRRWKVRREREERQDPKDPKRMNARMRKERERMRWKYTAS